jgi:hypothetical protein
MIDGPQGLASNGNSLRACERECGAAGKTPHVLPALGKPFAGFVRSSVELFGAMAAAGLSVSPSQFMGGVAEVYQGDIWYRLVGRTMPKKNTHERRRARKRILQALGVIGLPDLPIHDQNDACISALIAAAADGKVNGMSVRGIGLPLARDADGTLREGLVVPFVSSQLRQRLNEAVHEVQSCAESGSRPIVAKHRVQKPYRP